VGRAQGTVMTKLQKFHLSYQGGGSAQGWLYRKKSGTTNPETSSKRNKKKEWGKERKGDRLPNMKEGEGGKGEKLGGN